MDKDNQAPQRGPDGTFLPGVSGNPKGRPPSKKNRITELQQDMQLALRKGIKTAEVQSIIQSMIAEAQNGSVGAAKLILDKVLPNAASGDDIDVSRGGITIVVTNATQARTVDTVDGDFTEENDDG